MSIKALAYDCELRLLHFDHFGKGFVKRAKLHPDFFMQVVGRRIASLLLPPLNPIILQRLERRAIV